MSKLALISRIGILSSIIAGASTCFGDEVNVSTACSKELYVNDAHIVLIIRNDTSIDDVVSPAGKIPYANLPLKVNLIGAPYNKEIAPKAITLVPYTKSPVQTLVCWWTTGGKYVCK